MLHVTDIKMSEWRYERKFVTQHHPKSVCEKMIRLHPAMFRKVFPRRAVNNIYLDFMDRQCYMAGQIGLNERVKFRIRWYGSVLGEITEPVLELKIKHNMLGTKKRYPLPDFSMQRGFSTRTLNAVFANAELPPALRHTLSVMEPVLVNHYNREYYLSDDKEYRLTIDWDLENFEVNPTFTTFCGHFKHERTVILELKYDSSDGLLINHVTDFLSHRFIQHSKYLSGMEQTVLR